MADDKRLSGIFINWKSCFKKFLAPQGSVDGFLPSNTYLGFVLYN